MSAWHRPLGHPDAALRRAARRRRQREALHVVAAAASAGDAAALAHAVRVDVALVVDTGGAVSTPARLLSSAPEVAAALVCLVRDHPGATLEDAEVNGAPGLALRTAGRTVGIVSATMRGGVIDRIWVVLNPEKLASWNPA